MPRGTQLSDMVVRGLWGEEVPFWEVIDHWEPATPKAAIEIRFADDSIGNKGFILAMHYTDNGLIGHRLARGGDGVPNALGNLQAQHPWPQKAVKGWQREALQTAATTLYRITEVR